MEKEAKIYIMGAAAVLVSGVKLEDWEKAERYASDRLKIMDENGESSFFIRTGGGGGTVTEYGISWGSYTSVEGHATVTVLLDEDVENKREAVMDIMGNALLKLMEMEKALPEILEQIDGHRAKIGDQIVEI